MLSIKCTEASKFQNSLLSKEFLLPIKPKYFIGRGEQLEDKLSQHHGIIDLNNFDHTLSRVHASLAFSPAWFTTTSHNTPKYLHQIVHHDQTLPPDVVDQIWQFLKPQKQCFLKDLKSKVGIFSKISSQEIRCETVIEFVHQSFIKFEYSEQHQTFKQLQDKVKIYQGSTEQKPIVFGNLEKIKFDYETVHEHQKRLELLKIWHLRVKQTKYAILMEQGMILRIGRSSHCQIQIKDTAISRYQAYLKCQKRKWKIHDGNMVEKSKNGTWKREKSIPIPVSTNLKDSIKRYVKIGTIKCEIQLIEKFEWLNIQKIANGDISKSFIQIGMARQEQNTAQQTQNVLINQNIIN